MAKSRFGSRYIFSTLYENTLKNKLNLKELSKDFYSYIEKKKGKKITKSNSTKMKFSFSKLYKHKSYL